MEPAHALTDAARELAVQGTLAATQDRIVALATTLVPGADSAGLVLARSGRLRSVAATDRLAADCDAAQLAAGEGPCVRTARGGGLLVVADFTADRHRSGFAAEAARHGVRGALSCHLSGAQWSAAALTCYARVPGAFGRRSRTLAALYAVHAAIALQSALRAEDLREAVVSRETIGRAVGILTQRHQVTARQAFELLARASQETNV